MQDKDMIKKIFIIVFLFLTSIIYAEHDWVGLKLGIGNETAGTGIALEGRLSEFGLVIGGGFPNGRLGGSVSLKYYILDDVESSIFVSGGWGILSFLMVDTGQDFIEDLYTYGPFLMVGTSNIWFDFLLADFALGVGYSSNAGGVVLAAQSSLGFVFDR